jgi:hypothetical protein
MDPVRAIADAVLYEGYILWPYRRSALKNTRRWTFGGVYPPAHSRLHPDDRSAVRAEVLVRDGEVDVRVRFLQVVRRQVFQDGRPVDECTVDGARLLSWEEAREREVGPGPFVVPAGRERDGAVERSWNALRGRVEVESEQDRVAVRIVNETPWDGDSRDDALAHTLCSAHAVLTGADFVSSTESEGCRNDGLWPVLVGDGRTMLCSPIILEDFPRIAPESPGDLFDGGEIDQLLVLNILSLTDEEKDEMRASDPRAREILERTESLTPDQLMRLHGRLTDLRRVMP